MRRQGLFVLLLGAGLALGGSSVGARQDQGAPAAPAEAPPGRTGEERLPADGAQEQAPEPRTETEGAGGDTAGGGADAGDPALIAVPGGSALGMSILGNQEAPTSLVIVPWKTSELGTGIGISPLLDDSRQPVDRDVFMRALRYYEIRVSDTTP